MEKNHKKPSSQDSQPEPRFEPGLLNSNTSAAHLIVASSERQNSVDANLSGPLPNHDHHNYIFHTTLCEL